MAVAAYASLVSLTHVLDNLHHRAHFNLPPADTKQVQSLRENVDFLLNFVELHSERKSPELGGLWKQMAEAAAESEGAINFHTGNLLDAIYQGETSDASDFSAFSEEMQTLKEKFRSIKKEFPVIEEEAENARSLRQPNPFVGAGGSSLSSSYLSNVVVGLDEHINRIRDKLIRGSSNLQILPIVGMGGIGKTTLAKSVFDDSFVIDHFDLRIWLSISQQYSVENILKIGLEEKAGQNDTRETLDVLGTRFYQKLFGRRYLIVLDDMWTIGAWNDLKRFLPNNENGSRILFTSRISDMAASLGTYDPYLLTFLDENNSWTLFCQNAFSQIDCPYAHLEKFAKDIAKSCRGLTLEIVVVGRLLANSNMTSKYWEHIRKSITSLANLGEDEHCMKILSLSYKGLPIHLKACFLYMRVFPEDHKIDVSELIKFWIAEGFIKSVSHRCLEDIAKEYVKVLIDRNLIFSRDTRHCGIHDLLRDLCLRESENECFLQFPRKQIVDISLGEAIHCNRCLKRLEDGEGMHIVTPFYIFGSSLQLDPFLCDACTMVSSLVERQCFVKIANHKCFEKELLLPIESRHVKIDGVNLVSPSTLQLLWNLQTLKIYPRSSPMVLPQEIWKMPQLREIDCSYKILLPDPIATEVEGKDLLILNDLHTIDGIYNFKCTMEVIDRIPNLKKLNVHYEDESNAPKTQSNYSLCNLEKLQKLESLSIHNCSENMSFPNSLKHLSVWNCRMAWEDMSIVGSLPSLESLEINGDLHGSEWLPIQGEFLRLKELVIEDNDLVYWGAEAAHFPILQSLRLAGLSLLEEIPSGIGDILTLQSIQLDRCSESVFDSAKEIWEEQHEVGNEIRISVIDNLEVTYAIGTFTARMTGAACQSLAYLKFVRERLQEVAFHGRDSLSTKKMEVVEEAIHFLNDFVKVFHTRKSQEIEGLLTETALAARRAKVVTRRLRSKNLMPLVGKYVDEDVERLLATVDYIRNKLSVANEEGKEDRQIDVNDNDIATSYDIDSLKIFRDVPLIDEDLREYQIGSVMATMTTAASLTWSDLACILEVLLKTSELGRHHLKKMEMENVEKSICVLRIIVEVHPQILLQTSEIIYDSYIIYLLPAAEHLNSKHLSQQSLDDASDESLLCFSEDVKYLVNILLEMESWFDEDDSQEEPTDEGI
ncbi:putative late blight resistance protein homolog R1B-14 [Andrographis paniculata]|uniref:putative late blight resistance protein homolog R1B-14 n=1 Tax=Andrographis paniculata TaxID=175694 RepID=UPI0021E7FA5D|nr:putative late blight resistance protein homolog R1B-14 [Andrographis paniculata]